MLKRVIKCVRYVVADPQRQTGIREEQVSILRRQKLLTIEALKWSSIVSAIKRSINFLCFSKEGDTSLSLRDIFAVTCYEFV